jgi:hypothetical protein
MEQASFWRTLPGLLTAIAGVVTAVTGLLVALPRIGLLEREAPPANIREAPPENIREAPPANISGVWVANVTYSWGVTQKERFSLQADGTRVIGTATFLGVPRAAADGTLAGDTVSFSVRGEELLGSDRRPYQLTYRGTVVGGGLHFVLEDSRGNPPIQFAAMRE